MNNSNSYAQGNYPHFEQPQQFRNPANSYYQYQQNPYTSSLQIMEHPNSNLVLALGIAGFFFLGITAPFAWYYGSKARGEIARNPDKYISSEKLTIGWILGIVNTIIMISLTVLTLLAITFFIINFRP